MSDKVVLGLVRDLFFRAKIDAVAEPAGFATFYASDLESAKRQCAAHRPSLILIDLSESAFPIYETAGAIKSVAPGAQTIGFASHLDLKPLRAAREAGISKTLSRSEFTAQLASFFR